MSSVWGVPYREVGKLFWDEFVYMLEHLTQEARRQQSQTVQLTYVVSSALGGKASFDAWYSGYARETEQAKRETGVPAHLQRALEVGIALGTVSDEAFATVRSVRG